MSGSDIFKGSRKDNLHKDVIIVVDDVEINRIILENMLSDNYIVLQAENGSEALNMMTDEHHLPSLVLLDIIMPDMDGFEVLEKMKRDEKLKNIPVIFITSTTGDIENEIKGLSKGACDYITKPFDDDIIKLRVSNQIELYKYRSQLETMVVKKVNELTRVKDKMLETLASLIEYRSLESGEHVKRTSLLAQVVIDLMLKDPACRKKLMDTDYHIITKAGALHDIGKIAIPDNILLKPGKLTPEEFKIIETHTIIGSEIIDELLYEDNEAYLRHCHDICRHHHECWNGTGYPDGLAGEEIPISARIISIVDVYDALVSNRVYKPAYSHEDAMDLIVQQSGIKFDPEIIRLLEGNCLLFKNIYDGK